MKNNLLYSVVAVLMFLALAAVAATPLSGPVAVPSPTTAIPVANVAHVGVFVDANNYVRKTNAYGVRFLGVCESNSFTGDPNWNTVRVSLPGMLTFVYSDGNFGNGQIVRFDANGLIVSSPAITTAALAGDANYNEPCGQVIDPNGRPDIGAGSLVQIYLYPPK